MRCPNCKRAMTALFTSYACDYCDGLIPINWLTGFIVFRGDDDFTRPVYVFPTRTEAAIYRQVSGWQQYPIREIHFEHPVRWKAAAGKLQGVNIAAQPFALYRDHRFESVPYSGYLADYEPSSSANIRNCF